MLKVVVDTNVIISAALSPSGNAAKILNFITDDEKINLFYSAEILSEYRQVLSRKHLRIDPLKQTAYVEAIKSIGIEIDPVTSDIPLPDESDRTFYDTARQVEAVLITGNKKHYPAEGYIMSPAQFLAFLDGRTEA